jgi:hypothetical protein
MTLSIIDAEYRDATFLPAGSQILNLYEGDGKSPLKNLTSSRRKDLVIFTL